jgi:hypothetical protein
MMKVRIRRLVGLCAVALQGAAYVFEPSGESLYNRVLAFEPIVSDDGARVAL